MTRILMHAVHQPRPEHVDDLLAAMSAINTAADGLDGLEHIGAFQDPATGKIVAISLWGSMEALQAGAPTLLAGADGLPFDRWEDGEPELSMLSEVAR
ncbi:hypothetical protein [Cellulomonas soli]|uniref:ABM domain-containing protein n=1 Tax=Cellulomonas soli TaxID=931535 RepID=A0A512PDX6_9CELL|nr:hypothetical protein [Cellulomonas soli]NYI59095.1 heme-degrading monooxygenase HmoA [Cellulomonas soli]GEP69414.1 hypothetical protein CSO01_21290 [Cellulomonas soli]